MWLACKSGAPTLHSYPSYNIFVTSISWLELEYMKTQEERRTEGIWTERERKGFLCKSVKPPKKSLGLLMFNKCVFSSRH
jgi:hypothetical protein